MSQSTKTAIAWAMVLAWAAVVFFMSANTGDDLSDPEGILGLIKLLDDVQLVLFGPGRFCDPVDWLVDTAGALVGALIISPRGCLRPNRDL